MNSTRHASGKQRDLVGAWVLEGTGAIVSAVARLLRHSLGFAFCLAAI
ncbi:hypothetical protein BRCON_0284 [Candidatus Sumerlaea chitinivorans]|uniref:Uncharacterized protein n=1 Tax=Sumerlaea chitinivorans TaxID=2250252 RepID=A0A2Z4Y1I1_SUMC1|nr:hypothetical protein BRCON_0284 [Candidatus Sumerlaea chitinivorans]